MPVNFGGPGVSSSTPPSVFTLAAGQTALIPSGRWEAKSGRYSTLQEFDQISQFWRTIGGGEMSGSINRVVSDGFNYRFANQTGCVVGANMTNGGAGYTSAPVITASAGNSLWRAVIGGALSATITIVNNGINYTYPPQIVIAPPPPGGVQATAVCTIVAGLISTVIVTNQGAGYTGPPMITVNVDPRENNVNGFSPGYNGQLTASLTGAGTITAMICIDHGNPLTAVPTLAFSGGGGSGAAAVAVMCWTITSFTVTAGGVGLSGNQASVTAQDLYPAATTAYVNPAIQALLVRIRNASIKATITANAIVAKTNLTTNDDGGIYTSVPAPIVNATASIITGVPIIALVMGGVPDDSILFST